MKQVTQNEGARPDNANQYDLILNLIEKTNDCKTCVYLGECNFAFRTCIDLHINAINDEEILIELTT